MVATTNLLKSIVPSLRQYECRLGLLGPRFLRGLVQPTLRDQRLLGAGDVFRLGGEHRTLLFEFDEALELFLERPFEADLI